MDKVHSYLIFLPGIQDIDWLYEGIETKDRGQSIEVNDVYLLNQPSPSYIFYIQ